MTADKLSNCTCKDLAEMARKRGVSGWHAMRKDQLAKALVRASQKKQAAARRVAKAVVATRRSTANHAERPKPKARQAVARQTTVRQTIVRQPTVRPPSGRLPVARPPVARKVEPPQPKNPHVLRRLQQARSKLARWKNLAFDTANGHSTNGASTNGQATNGKAAPIVRDRLVVMVRDSYWLHAYWELSRQGVERAEAAMSQEWHSAKPILRLLEVTGGGTTCSAECHSRDIEIHGGVNNWYVDVVDPPKSYRMDIGYRAESGKFFVLCRSNVVTTPPAGASDAIDKNWVAVAENFDKIYALSGGYAADGPNLELQQLFEERLRRPMGSPMSTRFGSGAEALAPKKRDFAFELDAELIVYGTTEPDAHVTLQGEPVRLRPDGSFTVRYSMPNCRQVIPAVASSANGLEQRTVVLAVERNTKVMEPLIRDSNV